MFETKDSCYDEWKPNLAVGMKLTAFKNLPV